MKKIFFTTICLLISLFAFAQYPSSFQVIHQSSKPDFESFLQGVRNWDFGEFKYNGQDMSDAQGGDFAFAYVYKEVEDFMKATLPDATFGIDYRLKSTTQLLVDVTVRATPQLRRDGRYVWYINCSLDFSPLPLQYYYSYSIPQVSVVGNSFGDHSLYNALLSNVTRHIIHHSYYKEIHLKKIKTGWTENKLKQSFDNGINHGCEGIYEAIEVQEVGKYKLGVKSIGSKLYLIFLDGAIVWDDWQEGELKAELDPTATPNLYKATWYNTYKRPKDAYVTFEINSVPLKLGRLNISQTAPVLGGQIVL